MSGTSQRSMPSERAARTKPRIPLCVPEIGGNEWEYVKECLDTGWVSSVGSFVDRFERMLAEYVGARRAVATVNGTAALHVALIVAGVEPDDEVLVPTLTFIAPANAVRYVGAHPVLIDAEPSYWQMDAERVLYFLGKDCRRKNGGLFNRSTNRRVKAIIPVHILGHPVEMSPVLEAARDYGLTVIEDATESLGARYEGKPVGRLGDIACFSFNGNKLITSGGGGMILTDNEEWAQRARYLTTQAKDDPLEYVHGEVGYNYRLTNIQAALGCAQMERLDEFITRKRNIAHAYAEAFKDVPGIETMSESPRARSVFWMNTVLVEESERGEDSRGLMRRLSAEGIETRPLWQPLHHSVVYQDAQRLGGEVAEGINLRALSLPSSVGLSATQIETVVEAVKGRAR
jgi:perosamine synthetase